MLAMNELVVDWRMQQHFAEEIYRQQIMQRIPDPFHHMLLPLPVTHPHVIMPTHSTLPNVEAKLENKELWQQFHHIGTEMIITKTGRRMFPSMRLTLSGLEDESNYCVLLEMIPIGDCRYKFSGSQWLPAGGAEPQSPQRMFLHPDSPATGAHWQAQPILFNKVKLTNNTLDNNGHMVLASMHKYQPRLHIIRASDLAQMPWAPQKAVVFPETEFIAVTAYQNDRITKLKIDNNPFAKGFRESGQSRCKRKMSTSPTRTDSHEYDHKRQQMQQQLSQRDNEIVLNNSPLVDDDRISVCSQDSSPHSKRLRSNGSACSASSLDEGTVTSVTENEGSLNIRIDPTPTYHILNMIDPSNTLLRPLFNDYYSTYFTHPHTSSSSSTLSSSSILSSSSPLSSSLSSSYSTKSASPASFTNFTNYGGLERIPNGWCCQTAFNCTDYNSPPSSPDTEPGVATNRCLETFVDVESMPTEDRELIAGEQMMMIKETHPVSQPSVKRHSFSISAILGTGEKDIRATS